MTWSSKLKIGEWIEKLHTAASYLCIDLESQVHKIKMAMEGGGGGTLSELYQRSKRLLLTTRDGLERLERLEFSSSNSGVDSPELSFSVKRDIGQIQLLCVEMDRLWRSIAAKSQRDLWKSGDGGGLWRCRGGAAAAWMQQVLRGHSGGGNLRAEMVGGSG
ncbi:hypothetical protein RHSIM_Rhsim02G0195800 [Rhododendron simsii]|uniref:Uncharacterized protein n=1 Tax=Rhododendron simsii TaxID=118357 RepID=A0A834HCP1_RHOSS|nr:hypothetical protein RHSIM_Rhsim02G0195800 [Rhododendron simsii]